MTSKSCLVIHNGECHPERARPNDGKTGLVILNGAAGGVKDLLIKKKKKTLM